MPAAGRKPCDIDTLIIFVHIYPVCLLAPSHPGAQRREGQGTT